MLKKERIAYWMGKGALPTATVDGLLKKSAKAESESEEA